MSSYLPPSSETLRPDVGKPDQQLNFELYRLRSEEYERSFYSLRAVEWQIAFQIYAGYAAVAAGFFSLRSTAYFGMSQLTLAALSIFSIIVLFGVSLFCQTQVLRRMHFSRAMQNAYLEDLHSWVAPELPLPPKVVLPSFAKWWAFIPLQSLNVVAAMAIVIAILYSIWLC